MAHGVFDVLHIGHLRLLRHAKNLGDRLVVSLLADKYVTMYKGANCPLNNLEIRIEQMKSLRYVDQVVVVDGPGHEAVREMIERIGPNVYVKGADTKGTFGEEEFVKARGIKMVFFDMIGNDGKKISTTGVREARGGL